MQLEARKVSYRYGTGPWIFRDLNFSLQEGEIVGLRGPSGCGKTTFGRLLSGYDKPVEGHIFLSGRPIPKFCYNPVQLVFQHPEKAVNSRWQMRKTLHEGWKPDEDLLSSLGIEEEWLTRWPNELSGGELQRFCVARALGPKTKFLIADEMTTMLDANTQAQIWQGVIKIAERRNMAILIVSHDQHLMNRLCSKIIDFHNT